LDDGEILGSTVAELQCGGVEHTETIAGAPTATGFTSRGGVLLILSAAEMRAARAGVLQGSIGLAEVALGSVVLRVVLGGGSGFGLSERRSGLLGILGFLGILQTDVAAGGAPLDSR
jgi:hypothetical protein